MVSCVHTQSTFCDGKNTMEEMALAAYKLGISSFGFSGHAYYPNDPSFPFEDFGIKPSSLPEYFATAKKIKEEYAGKMDVLCGIEIDEVTPPRYLDNNFEYVIGSSHAVKAKDGKFYVVDYSSQALSQSIEQGFNNDPMEFAREYYSQFYKFVQKIKPDIVGHIDLLCKFNSKGEFFNVQSNEYKTIALDALDEILKTDSVIEVNTGAISRGYTTAPYPDIFLLKRILEKNGRIIITTDTHCASTVDFYAKEAQELVKSIGFKSIWNLTSNGFIETKI